MRRRAGQPIVALFAALAFLANVGVVPAIVGACAHHDSVPVSQAAGDHGAHHDHQDPPEDGLGCLCLGDCCPGDTAGPAILAGGPDFRIESARSGATRVRDVGAPAPGPRLLPFANGPPFPA